MSTKEAALQGFCDLLAALSGVTVLIAYGAQPRPAVATITVQARTDIARGYPVPTVKGLSHTQRRQMRLLLLSYDEASTKALERAAALLCTRDARVLTAAPLVAVQGVGEVSDVTAQYRASYEARAMCEVQIGYSVVHSGTQAPGEADTIGLVVNGITFEDA